MLHAEPQGVLFHPVGWEDTVGGVGRPQELINEDLKQCDYAVFVLHDRWGSPTGGGYTSGTEEEWTLAEELYKNKIRNIALFFKNIVSRQLSDPGKQLESVLAFKKKIEEGKRYLFKQYGGIDQFSEALEAHLAKWLRDHLDTANGLSTTDLVTSSAMTASMDSRVSVVASQFDYWITEAIRYLDAEIPDPASAMFCAAKAIDSACSDIEWARARNVWGITQFHLGKLDEAIMAFTAIVDRFTTSIDSDCHEQVAQPLFNKGFTLGTLDRSAEAIAAYDDLLVRFGAATELPLRDRVAKALVNKGFRLGTLDRSAEAIAVYDDLLARFGAATELPLRELIAKAKSFREKV